MKFLVLLFVILSTSQTEAREFVCGFKPALESEGTRGTQGTRDAAGKASSTPQDDAYYRSGIIRPLFVFGKFKDSNDPANLSALLDREGVANRSAGSLLTATYEGSLAHYFDEMSDGALTLTPPSTGIDTNWYESDSTSVEHYVGPTCENSDGTSRHRKGVGKFMQEVLAKVDARVDDFSQYDRNMDGVIDVVGLFVPPEFLEKCGKLGTAIKNDNDPKYVDADGNTVATHFIVSSVTYTDKRLGTLPPSFPFMVSIMAHEYGHLMGLPELRDTDPEDVNKDKKTDDIDYPYHSAGIGRWGLMGLGPLGWEHEPGTFDGPTPMSAWSRMKVGWISPVTVEADMSNVSIHDITSSVSSAYKIPISSSEYFLVANRQNTYSETTPPVGSYYDDYAPASGLAIWHVDEDVPAGGGHPNNNEFHKFVDLECADGLFSDKGYNPNNSPNSPNSVSGGDNLDYLSIKSYRESYNGNLGDSTDMWNGLADTRLKADTLFTPYTNPSTAGYEGNSQSKFTGIALRDIRSSSTATGVMQMDLYLQYWAGPITSNTTWSGRITVGGDVTIESGVTLTVERGTEVRFLANTDDTGGGKDQTRSELIVKGKLDADAGNITFRSSDDPGTNADWYGIRVASGGIAELSGATIQNGFRCMENEGGTVTGLSDANTRFLNCGATIVEAQYAYQASQTAPLPFDTDASGTPDNWSSSELTWTDTAPRVWRISRMRPHGGTWSEWGTLEKFSERPAPSPVFYYLHAASAPGTPDNRISDQPPSGWLSSEPEATATQGVWRTKRTRPAGETHYRFSTPTQITPPGTETEYAYRASQPAPLYDAVASGTPDNWSSSELTWTDAAPRVWRIRRTRPSGGTWSEWGTLEKYSERPAPPLVSFYRQAANNPGVPSSTPDSDPPSNWETSNPGATTTLNVWQTQRSRPPGDTHYEFTTPTIFEFATVTQSAYRLHTSGTTAPAFSAPASVVPSGWSSLRQTPSPSNRYEWRIRRTRSTDGSWSSWGSAVVVVETEYAYRASQPAPLFDAVASGTPDNWSSSELTWTDAAPRVWRISRMRPHGGTWSEWGTLEKFSERPAPSPVFYYLHAASAPGTPDNRISDQPPSGWLSSEPEATATQGVWRTKRTRPTGETHYHFSAPTQIETEYAYRASQTAPLFDAVASGTPDNWSSSELTWTDAAPRVWSIRRTRPSGGTWSAWGTLEKYSERPVAQPDPFYRQAASQPDPPGNTTSSATPTDWLTSNPGATATESVWRTERTRPAGETHYRFSAPIQIETEYAYRLHTSGTTAPSFTASASGVPTGWSSSRQPPTSAYAPYEWQIRRTRPTGGTWSSWSGATVVATYTEYQYAYKRHNSGTTAPAFSSTASGVPYGWSSSRQTPTSSNRYEWRISRTRPAGGSWSSWGSATVVSKYTETETAYRLHTSGTTAPSFTASASGVPYGWSSSRQTPTSAYAPYEWEISRTRPAGESWSSWGSATVVSKYTERQYAYRVGNSGSTAPSFSASSSGIPTGWSSSRRTPGPSVPYEWEISRTRPAGESWSSWGSATVVSKYTERQSAYRRNNSGSTPPSFSASASGVPSGWSSSRQTPTSSNRYEWKITRTRPAGESWSSWGSATVVSKYTERQSAYRRNNSGSTPPSFSASASGVPSGWSSSRQTPTSSNRYEWKISRTRPAGESWSSWGSATVVSKYTERQTAYKRNDSGTTAPAFSSTASGLPYGWSSSQPSATSSNRYVWRITRTRPAGESWSSWGSATVVSKYTERQYAYRVGNSGSTAPSFSASSSGIPTGWSSSRRTPGPSVPYEWRITRTRPTGGTWSNWGGATVVNTWTASMGRYRDGLKRLGFLYAADFRQFSRSEDVSLYEKRLTPRSLDGPVKQPKEVLRTLLSTR